MTRNYDDDTTPDDLQSGDQCSVVCECSHQVIPAWKLLTRQQQFTPLRRLRTKMVCRKCGGRNPTIVIDGFYGTGGDLKEFWRWPKR